MRAWVFTIDKQGLEFLILQLKCLSFCLVTNRFNRQSLCQSLNEGYASYHFVNVRSINTCHMCLRSMSPCHMYLCQKENKKIREKKMKEWGWRSTLLLCRGRQMEDGSTPTEGVGGGCSTFVHLCRVEIHPHNGARVEIPTPAQP